MITKIYLKMSKISTDTNPARLKGGERALVLAIPQEDCGEVNIGGRGYVLSKDDAAVLSPGMDFDGGLNPHGGWRLVLSVPLETVMELPSPFDTDLVSHARHRPVVPLTEHELGMLERLYGMLRSTLSESQSPFGEEVAKSIVFAMLYRLGNIYARLGNGRDLGTAGSNERLSDEFFALLARHYKTERKVSFYAGRMSVTPKYLTRAMQKITGKSAKQWLDEAIMLEIKNLLRTSDLTVLQISEALGFSTPSAMIQYFRKHSGQTPARYRKDGKW